MTSLRSHIGVVPQDTILFNASLMYNLLYAKWDASFDEIQEACNTASIHQRILGFPDRYQTVVGERGARLSGGEKQRVSRACSCCQKGILFIYADHTCHQISIARAILRKPQIMLLDEATASLDSHTEQQIQGALEAVTAERTTVIIA